MNTPTAPHEVFRRSGLTTLPEWFLAGSTSLAVGLAARHTGMQTGWEALVLVVLPIVWAGGRTLQWLFRTWNVTQDGVLVLKEGVLFRTRRVIHLCSVGQVAARAPLPAAWLDIGDVAFEATSENGQREPFHWTWMGNHNRLCEIIEARGRLPVGAPTWWQMLRPARERLQMAGRGLLYTQRRAELQNYGRFMAFCHHLLRADRDGQWPPPGLAQATVECWMAVLRRIRVVADAPNGRGWRVAQGIQGLECIQRRIGPEELQRAVRQLARFR